MWKILKVDIKDTLLLILNITRCYGVSKKNSGNINSGKNTCLELSKICQQELQG